MALPNFEFTCVDEDNLTLRLTNDVKQCVENRNVQDKWELQERHEADISKKDLLDEDDPAQQERRDHEAVPR